MCSSLFEWWWERQSSLRAAPTIGIQRLSSAAHVRYLASVMAGPGSTKLELAMRWLNDPAIDLNHDERELLQEYVRRYPDDPTLTPVDRRRLAREFALIASRLAHDAGA
jgi:hypothetical protein